MSFLLIESVEAVYSDGFQQDPELSEQFIGSSCLRLRRDGGVLHVQDVQLLDAAPADRHRGVSESHGGSPPGPAGAAAGWVVRRPLLAGQGGAATGPEAHRLRHAQLAVGHLIRELVVL